MRGSLRSAGYYSFTWSLTATASLNYAYYLYYGNINVYPSHDSDSRWFGFAGRKWDNFYPVSRKQDKAGPQSHTTGQHMVVNKSHRYQMKNNMHNSTLNMQFASNTAHIYPDPSKTPLTLPNSRHEMPRIANEEKCFHFSSERRRQRVTVVTKINYLGAEPSAPNSVRALPQAPRSALSSLGEVLVFVLFKQL